MASRAVDRVVDFLIARHRILLVVAVVISIVSIAPSRRLTFDQSIESLYAVENVRLKDYVEGKSLFGGDEFVFVAYTDADLFSDEGQSRLEELANQLSEVPGVIPESIQSLPRTLAIAKLPFFKNRRDALIEFSRGVLLGADNQTTAVALRLNDPHAASVSRGIAGGNSTDRRSPNKSHICGGRTRARE